MAARLPPVELHAAAGRVDDESAALPHVSEQVIDTWRELLDSPHRVEAVVNVPHVAHNDGGGLRLPGFGPGQRVVEAALRPGLDAIALRDLEESVVGKARDGNQNGRKQCRHTPGSGEFHSLTFLVTEDQAKSRSKGNRGRRR